MPEPSYFKLVRVNLITHFYHFLHPETSILKSYDDEIDSFRHTAHINCFIDQRSGFNDPIKDLPSYGIINIKSYCVQVTNISLQVKQVFSGVWEKLQAVQLSWLIYRCNNAEFEPVDIELRLGYS